MGQKWVFYLRFLERLNCGVKQHLAELPAYRLRASRGAILEVRRVLSSNFRSHPRTEVRFGDWRTLDDKVVPFRLEIDDRTVLGLREGDLLCGSNNSQVATLIERHLRYCMLIRTDSMDAKTAVNVHTRQAHKPQQPECCSKTSWRVTARNMSLGNTS